MRRSRSSAQSSTTAANENGTANGRPQRFRARRILRASAVIGLLLWLAATAWVVLLAGFRLADIPQKTFVSLAFFDLLFLIVVFYYERRAVVIDSEGVIIVGALSFRSFAHGDILSVDEDPGFFPGSVIVTRRGAFGVSSLEFEGYHQLLTHLNHARLAAARTNAPPSDLPADNTENPAPANQTPGETSTAKRQRRQRFRRRGGHDGNRR